MGTKSQGNVLKEVEASIKVADSEIKLEERVEREAN